jgi:methylenetetrahydrofolate reductase (NADPH)
MTRPSYRNDARAELAAGRFVVSVECVTPPASEEFAVAIAPLVELGERIKGDGRIHTLAVTDRVKSDEDHDPVRVARHLAETSGKAPTVHLAGKDRDPAWLEDGLARAHAAGLENLLLVTGDKLKCPPGDRRVRYYDSVNMIAHARRMHGAFHVAAAVSPFKYREEELMNQYLKMAKKEHAGADCFITQIGWDMLKLKELAAYRRRRRLAAPVLAGVMLLTMARGRYVRTHRIAGITVTDALQARLETEAVQPDKGLAAAYRRLALQIVGVKRLGYAGFHLTGIQQFDKLDRLLREIDALDQALPTEAAWWDAWWDGLRAPDGRPVATTPEHPFYLYHQLEGPAAATTALDALTPRDLGARPAPRRELARFRALDGIDRLLFKEGSPGAVLLGPLARRVTAGSQAERGLHAVERWLKRPMVGCDTCGSCRLPHTMFVCPETCPKGLANGPCGGTSTNTCEFGDRECIHNQKYRLAKSTGRIEELETVLIPAVDAAARGTCSWTSHFRGEAPRVDLLPLRDAKGAVHGH